ncbi:hypothetical protein FZEAL_9851 [Fusarium zealandicum]|uniref:Uncharacterized protein n=1 Tax=Fusarium zealandicum TaxID=1053134 RepID=A0A8H4U7V9_9HYPO|nr:hypothetical protein FZEAL_9851 [Fusarium zealandicum]
MKDIQPAGHSQNSPRHAKVKRLSLSVSVSVRPNARPVDFELNFHPSWPADSSPVPQVHTRHAAGFPQTRLVEAPESGDATEKPSASLSKTYASLHQSTGQKGEPLFIGDLLHGLEAYGQACRHIVLAPAHSDGPIQAGSNFDVTTFFIKLIKILTIIEPHRQHLLQYTLSSTRTYVDPSVIKTRSKNYATDGLKATTSVAHFLLSWNNLVTTAIEELPLFNFTQRPDNIRDILLQLEAIDAIPVIEQLHANLMMASKDLWRDAIALGTNLILSQSLLHQKVGTTSKWSGCSKTHCLPTIQEMAISIAEGVRSEQMGFNDAVVQYRGNIKPMEQVQPDTAMKLAQT